MFRGLTRAQEGRSSTVSSWQRTDLFTGGGCANAQRFAPSRIRSYIHCQQIGPSGKFQPHTPFLQPATFVVWTCQIPQRETRRQPNVWLDHPQHPAHYFSFSPYFLSLCSRPQSQSPPSAVKMREIISLNGTSLPRSRASDSFTASLEPRRKSSWRRPLLDATGMS